MLPTKILTAEVLGLGAVFIVALVVCLVSASILIVLHFQMKFRLEAVGLPVKWFMMPRGDFRMWQTYVSQAPARQWPIWPFYAYRVFQALFGISGIVCWLVLFRR
jgi:hypothetical protein